MNRMRPKLIAAPPPTGNGPRDKHGARNRMESGRVGVRVQMNSRRTLRRIIHLTVDMVAISSTPSIGSFIY